MSKFAKGTKMPKGTPDAVNEMGERAYVLNPKEELVSTALTTFLSNSYYEKESEVVNRLKKAIDSVSTEFAAKLALYARNQANMRSISHLLAGELAARVGGKEWAKRFFQKVVVRPDDMREILAYLTTVKKAKNPTNAMRKAFKAVLEGLDPYQIDKYKMNGGSISLIDLVNLCRPVPTGKNKEAYRRLMKGEKLDGLYSSKILEKEMSKAGQGRKSAVEVEEAKVEAIEAVLDNVKGMPIMNLLRNLRNIMLIAPHKVKDACEQLTTEKKVVNSRLLPFRFASAYTEIEKLTYSAKPEGKTIFFEKDGESNKVSVVEFASLKELVLQSLDKALGYSVANIPKLVGSTAVLIDHSGSVRGDGGGSSKVSAFSDVTTAMIGNLFGSMLAYSQDNVYIGLFGDRLIPVPIDRKAGVLEFNKTSFKKGDSCGASTENGLYVFLSNCIKEKKRVDNLVIFSDMVIGSGGRGGWDNTSSAGLGSFQSLFTEFRKLNPQCLTVCVNIKSTSGKSVFDRSLNVMQIDGWSDKIFDLIASQSKGYDAIIKEIDSIIL